GAGDGVARDAAAALAGVGLRAGVAVVARRPVRRRGGGAAARRGVARARHVALVEGGAGDGVAPDAAPALAGVGLRAGVGVVAGRPVRRRGVGAAARRGIARARHVALVEGGAGDGVAPDAAPTLAGVGLRAGVAVVAGRPVRRRGVGAAARRGVARARHVAPLRGSAVDGVAPDAAPALAGVGLRAGVAVGAGCAVGLGGIAAGARHGIAGARRVALVGGRTHDRDRGVLADAGV